MKSEELMCIAAITLLVALAIPVSLAAQQNKPTHHHQYTLVDIGTFGGPASYINNQFSLGAPNQINSRGTTVGAAATSIPSPGNSNTSICEGLDGILPFVFHAFQWQDGAVTDLGTLPGPDNCSVATSINAADEIAGYRRKRCSRSTDRHSGGSCSRLGEWRDKRSRDVWGNQSVLANINNRGQVARMSHECDPGSFLALLPARGSHYRNANARVSLAERSEAGFRHFGRPRC